MTTGSRNPLFKTSARGKSTLCRCFVIETKLLVFHRSQWRDYPFILLPLLSLQSAACVSKCHLWAHVWGRDPRWINVSATYSSEFWPTCHNVDGREGEEEEEEEEEEELVGGSCRVLGEFCHAADITTFCGIMRRGSVNISMQTDLTELPCSNSIIRVKYGYQWDN